MNSKKSPTNIQRILKRVLKDLTVLVHGSNSPYSGTVAGKGGGGARRRNDRPMSLLFIGLVPRLRFFSMLSVFLKI